jgi:nucleotide-binding universal stress UspA family protein
MGKKALEWSRHITCLYWRHRRQRLRTFPGYVLHPHWKKVVIACFEVSWCPSTVLPSPSRPCRTPSASPAAPEPPSNFVHAHVLYALTDPACGRYAFAPEIDDEHRRQEQLYLEGTARWLAAGSSVPVTATVTDGLAADAILRRAGAGKTDLIVMTTHGRGGLGRFFLGSVADEIMRQAAVPVLLVRVREPAPGLVPEPPLEYVLVPLDGSALAEQVLEPALDLVRSWEGRCTLLRVVETSDPPTKGRHHLYPPEPEQEGAARVYLAKTAGRL